MGGPQYALHKHVEYQDMQAVYYTLQSPWW